MQSFEFVPVLGRRTQFDGLPDALRGEFVDDLFQTLPRQLRSLWVPKEQNQPTERGLQG